MKMETKKIILYIIVLCCLFLLPICMVIVNTDTLKDGNEFLFKVGAFDPYDFLRGNYLDISFLEDEAKGKVDSVLEYGDKCFAKIEKNNDGFAYFSDLTVKKPKDTSDYYETVMYYSTRIETPTRYYMNENKSLDAEEIYRENIENTYIKVRVKNGKMVIIGVYVDDKLIDTIEK